jgi:hypothetical protein
LKPSKSRLKALENKHPEQVITEIIRTIVAPDKSIVGLVKRRLPNGDRAQYERK